MFANRLRSWLFAGLVSMLAAGCGGEKPPASTGGAGNGGEAGGATGAPVDRREMPESVRIAYDRGLDYLKQKADEDGSFGAPGYTALDVAAFLVRPGGVRPEDREFVDKALGNLVSFQKEQGGIHEGQVANYSTSVAIMALAASGDPQYADELAKARDFVKSLQKANGGIGYSDSHPEDSDLSNTQFAIEALRAAGVPASDATISRALEFLQSVQNRSESNEADYTVDVDGRAVEVEISDDGGAFYKPGESKAGVEELPNGKAVLRSYGSMTYALLKCYLLAGLDKTDGRVQDAYDWIRTHFTVEENPGFPDDPNNPNASLQGYYYYLMTMAKALDLMEADVVTDEDGVDHEWRKVLQAELLERQREDGSWVNELASRWDEGNEVLATAYALIALSHSVE